MTDNDWPVSLRVITEEEEKLFPRHGNMGPPSDIQKQLHAQQKAAEEEVGHPSDQAREPDLEPIDNTPYED